VINNGGGRIFERLPVMDFPEVAFPYSVTPHDMDFEKIAGQFGVPYSPVSTPEELERVYGDAVKEISSGMKRHRFIEVLLSPEEDLEVHTRRNGVRV
jgi:2-succinyl-5-enolpyruvyl-6-hydroxy-3-cyclohexene-1-carboxylate synthase